MNIPGSWNAAAVSVKLGYNSGTCQGEEYLNMEKVHKSDVKRLVEKVNEAEFDKVTRKEGTKRNKTWTPCYAVMFCFGEKQSSNEFNLLFFLKSLAWSGKVHLAARLSILGIRICYKS